MHSSSNHAHTTNTQEGVCTTSSIRVPHPCSKKKKKRTPNTHTKKAKHTQGSVRIGLEGHKHSLVQVEEESAHEGALGEGLLGVSRGEGGVVQALHLLALHEPGERCQHDGGHDGHHAVQVARVHVLALRLVHRCLGKDGGGGREGRDGVKSSNLYND